MFIIVFEEKQLFSERNVASLLHRGASAQRRTSVDNEIKIIEVQA